MDLSKIPLNASIKYGPKEEEARFTGTISLNSTTLTLSASEGQKTFIPLKALTDVRGSKDEPRTAPRARYKLRLTYTGPGAQPIVWIVQFQNPADYDETVADSATNSPAAQAKVAYLSALKAAMAAAKAPLPKVKTEAATTITPATTPATAAAAVALAPLSTTAPPIAAPAATPTPARATPVARPVAAPVSRQIERIRAKLLETDPVLRELYIRTVREGTVSVDDFWHAHSAEVLAQSNAPGMQALPIPVTAVAAFIPNLKTAPGTALGGGLTDLLRETATRKATFVSNPEVHWAYMVNVPSKMSSSRFWELYDSSPYSKYVGGVSQTQLDAYVRYMREKEGREAGESTPSASPTAMSDSNANTTTPSSTVTPAVTPAGGTGAGRAPTLALVDAHDIFLQAKLHLEYQAYVRNDRKHKQKLLRNTAEVRGTDAALRADAAVADSVGAAVRGKSLEAGPQVKSETDLAQPSSEAAVTTALLTTASPATMPPLAAGSSAGGALVSTTTSSSASSSSVSAAAASSAFVASVLAAEDQDTLDWHSAPETDLASVSAATLLMLGKQSAGPAGRSVGAKDIESAKIRSGLVHSLNRLGLLSVMASDDDSLFALAAGEAASGKAGVGKKDLVAMELQSLFPSQSVFYEQDELTQSRDFSHVPDKQQKILALRGANIAALLSSTEGMDAVDSRVATDSMNDEDRALYEAMDVAIANIEYNLSTRKRRRVTVNLPWLSSSAQQHELQFATVDPRVLPCNTVTASTLAAIMTSAHTRTRVASEAKSSSVHEDVGKLTRICLELCKHYWTANTQRQTPPSAGPRGTEPVVTPEQAKMKMARVYQRISNLLSTAGELRLKLSRENNLVAIQQLSLAETTMRTLDAHWKSLTTKPAQAGAAARPSALTAARTPNAMAKPPPSKN